ncbi:MAG: hydroxylase [Halothiobacillus sp. 14-56-357]|jgi:flavin-dependent dehydrogenase|uniref:NAD(P)/FAD-dependent oxidoreductase n=1 Tax=Halothiobacillus sp. 15-55-196 TaxID=1970382 RepID=UPI000BC74823|nr:NAD(P)/FAD-dependent oxidoreductase [Halothiobacillus sp. 15-55-196]OZB36588.1 MAG: hydroxylase [Halothiobacillus sp. 15-55-196]OZB55849.1 MAG: hydroxylase [Halothiobacillus sp. 14-56-357]
MPRAETSEPAHHCDVLVIGGGPAGSTVAPLLVERGYRVVVLEKAHHPRFHIGESLLPANMPLFDRLGVGAEIRAVGMEKWGAEFVSPHHDHKQVFEFAEAWDKSMPMAYQVPRAQFDEILIRNARQKGAEVIEGCRAKHVEFLPDDHPGGSGARVTAVMDDGTQAEWETKFVVDASGRDTFLANKMQSKQRNPKHNSSAVYGHVRGAMRNDGKAEGNITIFWFDHGWFWFIPLMDGITSIGMVTWPYHMKSRVDSSLEQFLRDNIETCVPLAERLRDAEFVSNVEATGNYSYLSDRTHGQNYVLLGDAFAFIDPVFSSGVLLAMQSAVMAADAIDTALQHPTKAAAALKKFDKQIRVGPSEFSWFIYRMTNPAMRDLFMGPRNIFRVKEALLSLLAGDIYGKTPIWNSLRMMKVIYTIASFRHPVRAYRAWQARRFNIRPELDA